MAPGEEMTKKFITPHFVKLRTDLVTQKESERFHNNVDIDLIGGCWIWTGGKSLSRRVGKNAYYGYVNFFGKLMSAHRASWILHYGEIPDEMCVCHKCDNPICCNPEHLFLGTDKENIADKISKGRQNLPRGESHHGAILKEQNVVKIKDMLLKGKKSSELAKQFGVSENCIYNIKYGRTWKWIK